MKRLINLVSFIKSKSLFLLSILLVPLSSVSKDSPYFEEIKREYLSLLDKNYGFIPYRGTYLLPLSYSNDPNRKAYESITSLEEFSDRGQFNQNLEAEFQISFAFPIVRKLGGKYDLLMAYTHQSWWQVYNSDWSKPFRETNYMPEVFLRNIGANTMSLFGLDIDLLAYDFGYVHQSNGQIQELSRSWDRVFLRGVTYIDKTLISMTIWYRFPEKSSDDDNSDIYKYKGYGEIDIIHSFKKSDIHFRFVPGESRQGYELTYTYPINKGLRFMAKASYGYGLSMIGYDHDARRIGLGVSFFNFNN